MKNIIKYIKFGGIFGGFVLLLSFFLSILNVFSVNRKITGIINIIMMIGAFLVFGFTEGINSEKKGFLAGLKIGLYFLLIMIIINLIFFKSPFNISRMIYLLILLISSVLGAMVGINKKKKD